MIFAFVVRIGGRSGSLLPIGRRGGTGKVFVSALLAALAMPAVAIVPATAEVGGFRCGREDGEFAKGPAAIWFEVFERRTRLAHRLRDNGNEDLAANFEECALKALRRSAELGHAEAEYRYGLHLSLRKPITEDSRKEAYWWLRKAADRGHGGAKRMIRTWQ
ncbi:MAG: sel1 repeat family protein [Candidatus Odyssella sp.]|nr:sel1 repeat family protein [Candidatus Odyssella sp.]